MVGHGPDGPQAITVVEQILHRQMGPDGRELVAIVPIWPAGRADRRADRELTGELTGQRIGTES